MTTAWVAVARVILIQIMLPVVRLARIFTNGMAGSTGCRESCRAFAAIRCRDLRGAEMEEATEKPLEEMKGNES